MIAEVVQSPVATVEPGFTVRQAAKLMDERSVGALVIVDAAEHPQGIITDRDLVVLLAEGVDPDAATIGCFAGQMLQTARGTDSIREVTDRMRKHGVRRLPVVDGDNRLVGIVSLDDVLRLVSRSLTDLAETIENELSQERVATTLRRAPATD